MRPEIPRIITDVQKDRMDDFPDSDISTIETIYHGLNLTSSEKIGDTKIAILKRYRELLGKDLRTISVELESGESEYLKEIEDHVFSQLPFLDPHHDEDEDEEGDKERELTKNEKARRRARMQECLDEADRIENSLRKKCFREDQTTQQLEEIRICNDFGKLLKMAFQKDSKGKKGSKDELRFQAMKKMVLAMLIGEAKERREKDDENRRALSDFVDFAGKKMFIDEEPKDVYIVVTTGEKNEAIETKTVDEKPILEPGQRLLTLSMRRAKVKNKQGIEREINVLMESRIKDLESDIYKILRYGLDPSTKHLDQNGMRFVFESVEDFEDFYETLRTSVVDEVQKNVGMQYEKAEKRLTEIERIKNKTESETSEWRKLVQISVNCSNRLEIIDRCVDEREIKGSLTDPGTFKSRNGASGKGMKEHKVKWTVWRSNNEKRDFELQFMLADGYWDSLYKDGIGHDEYSLTRMKGLLEVIFPKRIHKNLDIKGELEKGVARIRRDKRNGFINEQNTA